MEHVALGLRRRREGPSTMYQAQKQMDGRASGSASAIRQVYSHAGFTLPTQCSDVSIDMAGLHGIHRQAFFLQVIEKTLRRPAVLLSDSTVLFFVQILRQSVQQNVRIVNQFFGNHRSLQG
jgi:hypothetical protein